jgi:hypothetical protein
VLPPSGPGRTMVTRCVPVIRVARAARVIATQQQNRNMNTSETTHSDLEQITVDRLTADLRRIDPAMAEGATFTHTEIENPAGVPMVLTSVDLSVPITPKPSLGDIRRSVKRALETKDIADRKAADAVERGEGGEVTVTQKSVSNPRGVAMVATFSTYTPPPIEHPPADAFVPFDVPITAAPPTRDQGRANRQRPKTSPTTSRRSSSDDDRGDPDPDLADESTEVVA